jgi:hypothetical protein
VSKKNHAPGPVPPGNRPQAGPGFNPTDPDASADPDNVSTGFSDQDEKRRLGGYETAGEHARQQPGAANDGDRHSKPNRGPN